MRCCPFVLIWAGVLGLAGDAWGQESAPPLSLAPDARVRVEADGPRIVEGRFEQFQADSLILRLPGGAPSAIPMTAVSRIWVRGRSTRTGLLAGGIAGVPIGVLVGAGLCDLERTQGAGGRDAGCTEHYLVTPVVTGVLGAGIGALIGHFVPRWNLRFQLVPHAP